MSTQATDTESARDLALIGAGYWGKNLARNFLQLGALHTMCDNSPETLSSYGGEYADVRKTSDFAAVLADPAVRKVAIAAPAALHYSLARRALEAGKDVYVEKPLCLKIEDAEALVALAESSGRILMVGHLLQYHPCIEKLREMVSAGELGELYQINSNRLNLGKFRMEENVLWSFAPHDISVILSLLPNSSITDLRSIGDHYISPNVADSTLTSIRFETGARAQIHVSWLNPFKEQKLTVVGSKGMVVFDDTLPWAEKLRAYMHYLEVPESDAPPTPKKSAGEPLAVKESEPLRCECRHFLDSCETRKTPRTDGREGLRVLKVLNGADKSLRNNGDVQTIS